tara:strand:+ start:83 stop:649 length:567 start_codon:yes stop_codon:yes gene_type:complete
MGGLDYYPSKFRHQEEKDKKAETNKKYRENNREKILEQKRQHYEANKEKILEQNRQYRENNKQIIFERKKKYRENNKEKVAESKRRYNQNNKKKIAERRKKYDKTPIGRKILRINSWRHLGVKLPEDYGDNWNIFYEEEYMKVVKCEECFRQLTEDKKNTSTTKCLDHCHTTGEFRNILCHRCNLKRG